VVELSPEEKASLKKILNALLKMDAKDILAYWIDEELEEAELYYKLHEISKDVSWDERVSKLFYDLYRESLEHSEILLREYKKSYPNTNPERPDVPSIENVLDRKLEDMVFRRNLKDILLTLMETEKLARDVYRYLAEKTKDEEKRKTFERLSKVEEGHYDRLRELYIKLYGEEGLPEKEPLE